MKRPRSRGGLAFVLALPLLANALTSQAATLPPDARDKCANATTPSPQNVWNYNTLYSASDVDWYLFNLPASGSVMVTLGMPGGNYRLDLYSSCFVQVGVSDRPGREFEQIFTQLAAGNYLVRVQGSSGIPDPAVVYGVRFQPLPAGVQILSSSDWTDTAGNLVISGEILNNNSAARHLAVITATYYDSSGAVLTTATATEDVNIMPGRSRSPFHLTVPKPPGYARYKVEVSCRQATSETPMQNFPVSNATQATSGAPWFRGSFTNNNGFPVKYTKTATTLYDAWGTVINTSVDATSPSSLAVGAAGTYSVAFTQHYSGWNRAAIVIQATQSQ